jgi:hypothetical protein
MSLLQKLERLFGVLEGHESEVAEQISKRASVSQEQVERGIETAREAVEARTNGGR